MKNILSENMLRFGVKNLSESNKKRLTLESILQTIQEHGLTEEVRKKLNESYPYDQLKNNPSPAVIAKAIYDAKGVFNDSEAWVVAALQACKDYNMLSKMANVFKSKYGITYVMYLRKFMEGTDLTNKIHNGRSVVDELIRLYGSEERANKAALQYLNTGITMKDRFTQTQAFKGTRADS